MFDSSALSLLVAVAAAPANVGISHPRAVREAGRLHALLGRPLPPLPLWFVEQLSHFFEVCEVARSKSVVILLNPLNDSWIIKQLVYEV